MNQQEFLAGSPRCDSLQKLYTYLNEVSIGVLYNDGTANDRDTWRSPRWNHAWQEMYNPYWFQIEHYSRSKALQYPLLATIQDPVHYWFARCEHATGTPIAWLWPKLRERVRRHEGGQAYAVRTHALLALPGWDGLDDKHCFHLSQTDPECLAYFQTDDKLRRDISTKISVGRFVKKFWPDLPDHEVAAVVNAHRSEVGKRGVKFSTDPDEIVRIYEYGPRSCMKGKDCVRVYGNSPDLAVAYLGNLESNEVSARAVVWPDEKLYVRVYGDDLLRLLLEQQGYENCDLDGARVRRIEERGSVVMPYLDGPQNAKESSCGQYMILTDDGEYECTNTSGYASGGREQCDCCGDRYDPDDLYTATDGNRVCGDCIGSDDYEGTSCSYVWAITDAGWIHDTQPMPRCDCWWSSYHERWVSEDLSYSDFDLVELECGDIVSEDEAVETVEGRWYRAEECIEIDTYTWQHRDDLSIQEWTVHGNNLMHKSEFSMGVKGEPLIDAWSKLLLAAGDDAIEIDVLCSNTAYYFSDELVEALWDDFGDDVLERLAELKDEELPLGYAPSAPAVGSAIAGQLDERVALDA
jgi:hypothetical protein